MDSGNEVTKEELLKIQDKYNEEKDSITDGSKDKLNTFMKAMYTEMLSEGMSIDNTKQYEELVKILEDL
jgi:hypothetical protein